MTNEAKKPTALQVAEQFAVLDRLDEDALVSEMAGRVVKHYLYAVEQWDPDLRKKVKKFQLSKPGVDAVCREMALKGEYIREERIDCTRDDVHREALFQCRAIRVRDVINGAGEKVGETVLDSAIGVKRQPLRIWKKQGKKGLAETEDINPHWYEHGAMKAARNARRRLIPEAVATELLKLWAQNPERVKNAPAPEPEEAPPARRAKPEAAEDSKSATEEANRKGAALAEIQTSLADAYGPGPPWEHADKVAHLKRAFGTAQWPELKKRTADQLETGLGELLAGLPKPEATT